MLLEVSNCQGIVAMDVSVRIGMASAAGLSLIATMLWHVSPASTQPSPAVRDVKVVRAEMHDLPQRVEAVGQVSALQQVQVVTQIDGQLISCLFTEGQDVAAGAVMFQIDPRIYNARLQQSKAALEKDQSQLSYAQMQLHRAQTLVKAGDQTVETTEGRSATVDQMQAAIAADQATIAADAVRLEFTSIRAPISGRVGKRLIDAGNVVLAQASKPLATITQLDPIAVEFHVPQASLEPVMSASKGADLTVDAFDESSGKQLASGALNLIEDAIDTTTATITMRAIFKNSERRLWPGQLVGARISLGVSQHVPAVPFTALKQSARGYMVYVVDPDGTVRMRAVTPGLQVDGLQGVTEGLQDGDLVVLSDQDALAPGARVHATIVSATATGGA
jgi:multidrug efflux system membrane fusion protein